VNAGDEEGGRRNNSDTSYFPANGSSLSPQDENELSRELEQARRDRRRHGPTHRRRFGNVSVRTPIEGDGLRRLNRAEHLDLPGAPSYAYDHDILGNLIEKEGRTFQYGNANHPHRATAVSSGGTS